MVATELDGRATLRLAVGSPQTQPRHVAAAWRLLQQEADALVGPAPTAAAAAEAPSARAQ